MKQNKEKQWFIFWKYKDNGEIYKAILPFLTNDNRKLKEIEEEFECYYIYTFPQLKQIKSIEELNDLSS